VIQNFTSDEKFTLDGASSDTLGLFVDYLAPMPLAEQRYTDSNTGEDEQITTPDDVFSNITYQINFYTFKPDDYNDSAIKAFCFGKSKLTLSRYPNYYFKIRKVSLQAVDSLGIAKRVDYVLTLTLAPFRYATDEYNGWTSITAGDDIYNNYTRYSKPTFEIVMRGSMRLTVNGSDFIINAPETDTTIIVDSERHITYAGTTLLTGKTNGKYPLFAVGRNQVSYWSITGLITSIKYKGNWRDY
jgi:phage-related protein